MNDFLVLNVNVANDIDGSHPFGGVLTDAQGRYLARAVGRLPPGTFAELATVRRRGRPKNEPKAVANLLHDLMARAVHDQWPDVTLRDARRLAVGAVIPTANGDVERTLRRAATSPTALDAVTGYSHPLVACGDRDGNGRFAALFHSTATWSRTADGFSISGIAWACRWGDKAARHVRGVWTAAGDFDYDLIRELLPSEGGQKIEAI